MNILKNIFVSVLLLFFLTNNSWSKSPSEFINSLSSEASNILSSKLSEEEKISRLKEIGLELGFRHVESGPLVRSSYHAARHIH